MEVGGRREGWGSGFLEAEGSLRLLKFLGILTPLAPSLLPGVGWWRVWGGGSGFVGIQGHTAAVKVPEVSRNPDPLPSWPTGVGGGRGGREGVRTRTNLRKLDNCQGS